MSQGEGMNKWNYNTASGFTKLDIIFLGVFILIITMPFSILYILYRVFMRYIIGQPFWDDPDGLIDKSTYRHWHKINK